MSKRRNWSLIGIADHEAVANVGGRVGAAKGPASFRRVFSKLRGRDPVQETLKDAGDFRSVSSDVEKNHRQAADLVRRGQLDTGLTVVMGGGHDHGHSHLLGIREALESQGKKARLGCINIDAHLDVRKPEPKITSGSPFFLALESGVLDPERFIEFGVQSHCNAPELWTYIESKGSQVIPFEDLRHGKAVKAFDAALAKLAKSCDAVVISLDLDAVASAFAPGVSAPQAEGFNPSEILEMMEIAGADAKTVSLGIFELNPEHDSDDITARLAATSAYHFIARSLQG
jgi:formimidoylglutamase